MRLFFAGRFLHVYLAILCLLAGTAEDVCAEHDAPGDFWSG